MADRTRAHRPRASDAADAVPPDRPHRGDRETRADGDRRGDRGVVVLVFLFLLGAAVLVPTFALGAGSGGEEVHTAPTAQIDVEFTDGGTVELTHMGGDELDARTLRVEVGGETAYESGLVQEPFDPTRSEPWRGDVHAGDAMTLVDPDGDHEGETVRIVWESGDSDVSQVLLQTDWDS